MHGDSRRESAVSRSRGISTLGGFAHMNKVFKILVCVILTIGALGKEAEQRYFSSPTPDPKLGRTVSDFGIHGNTIYITPETDRLFQVLFIIFVVVFVSWIFYSWKTKRDAA